MPGRLEAGILGGLKGDNLVLCSAGGLTLVFCNLFLGSKILLGCSDLFGILSGLGFKVIRLLLTLSDPFLAEFCNTLGEVPLLGGLIAADSKSRSPLSSRSNFPSWLFQSLITPSAPAVAI